MMEDILASEVNFAIAADLSGRRAAERIVAALSSAGYKIMPSAPTEPMKAAAVPKWTIDDDRAVGIYRAMFDVA